MVFPDLDIEDAAETGVPASASEVDDMTACAELSSQIGSAFKKQLRPEDQAPDPIQPVEPASSSVLTPSPKKKMVVPGPDGKPIGVPPPPAVTYATYSQGGSSGSASGQAGAQDTTTTDLGFLQAPSVPKDELSVITPKKSKPLTHFFHPESAEKMVLRKGIENAQADENKKKVLRKEQFANSVGLPWPLPTTKCVGRPNRRDSWKHAMIEGVTEMLMTDRLINKDA